MVRIRALLSRVPADVWWFVLPLALVVPLKFMQAAGQRWMSIDGGYYTEIARHVRDGLGFTTNVSLSNFGYETFPHPTSVYPLWPVMLGLIGRVTDLYRAAHWVPTVLYFTAVLFAFAFGRRVWPQPFFPETKLPFHGGHVVAAILASNRQFIMFTSIPYTEGISWTLFFAFFWRLAKKASDSSVRWGLELGIWMSLLYFARAQFMIVPLAVGSTIFLRFLVGPDCARWLRLGLSTLLVLGIALGGWWAYLRTFLDDPGPLSLLRFDQNRVNGLLSPFDVIVENQGLAEVVSDRLAGVSVAFDLVDDHSWHASFGAAHWALPIAVLIAAATIHQWARGWFGRQLAALRREDGILHASMVLLALGGLLSIHLAHKHFNGEWYFYRRQGMIAIFAFVLPMLWLLRRGHFAAVIGVGLLSTTVSLGVYELIKDIQAGHGDDDSDDRFTEIVGWLKQHGSREAPTTVAFEESNLQRVSWRTEYINYHWLAAESPYSDVRTMVDKLHAEYVILNAKRKKSWTVWGDGAGHLEADFRRLPETPSGFAILTPRTEAVPAPVSRRVLLIGVDGLSWEVMGPMIANGELPNFRKLWVEGASQTALDTTESAVCADVWATVATGAGPTDSEAGSSNAVALWKLAAKAGRSVGVLSWWADWPTGEVVGDETNDPPSAAPTAPSAPPIDEDGLLARAGLSAGQWAQVEAAPANQPTAYSSIKTFYALDSAAVRTAVEKLRTDPKDLTVAYLRGPDPVQTLAWDLVAPFSYARAPEHLDRDRGLVEGVYRYTDRFVGELIAATPPDTTILVVSDHGAEPCAAATGREPTEPPGCRTAPGVLFVTGPGIASGTHLTGSSMLDVMPTTAWILGLPLSKELEGHPLSEAFLWDYAARFGRTDVEAYGPPVPAATSAGAPPP